jgi:hypothetical protein
VGGLLRYLYGPGRHNEHTNPHLVAGWDPHLVALEPPVDGTGKRDFRPLTGLLEQPLGLLPHRPAKPVWHCSVRAAPGDRRLTDAQWAQVAREVLDRTGLAPDGDPDACRWVAVRHADDHVHLVVTLGRQDGRPARNTNDFYRVGDACRAAEQRLGLTRTAPLDRTASHQATRAETEKAARTGRREPARATLRREVRRAAVRSTTPGEFLDQLRGAGLLVRPRHSAVDPTQVTGYAVAIPGDRSARGEPVWFGGGRLAADLSLPKLLRRWGQPPAPMSPTAAVLGVDERRALWAAAQSAATAAEADIRRWIYIDPQRAADVALAASDALVSAAHLAEGNRPGPLHAAAGALERAAREAFGRIPDPTGTGTGLRTAARLLAVTGRARRDETTQLLSLVLTLLANAQAIADLRAAQHRHHQAAAAQQAADDLRAAHEALVAAARRAAPGHAATPTPWAASRAAQPATTQPDGRRTPWTTTTTSAR